jgi:hypothetical protein
MGFLSTAFVHGRLKAWLSQAAVRGNLLRGI